MLDVRLVLNGFYLEFESGEAGGHVIPFPWEVATSATVS